MTNLIQSQDKPSTAARTRRSATFCALTAVCMAVTAFPSAVDAQDAHTFDNAGVLLGQSVEEVTTALTRQGFDVDLFRETFKLARNQPYVSAINAHKEDDVSRETVVVRFDEPPSETHAYLIWRSIGYKPGKAPTLDKYRAAVRSKAGNETYWRDVGSDQIEQYVQWSRAGKKRGGLFNVIDSLPSSYPNPCVTGIIVRSSEEALAAKVRAQPASLSGKGPGYHPGWLVPQASCASGLLVNYQVPSRATGLVPNVNILLLDQARMLMMAEKRDKWLEERRAQDVDAAKKSSGNPIL